MNVTNNNDENIKLMQQKKHEVYYNKRIKLYETVILNNKKVINKNVKRDGHCGGSLPSLLEVEHNTKLPKKVDGKYVYNISQKDFKCGGVTICKPGIYKLCSYITFRPKEEFEVAIVIKSSNVILDMKNFVLKQKNNVKNVYGIVIARDVKYVTIKGIKNMAVIKNFTLAGIRVYGRTKYITIENVIPKQTVPVQLTNDQIPTDCNNILELSLNLGIAIGEGDTFGVHMQETFKENLVEELSVKNVTIDGSTIGLHMIFTFGFEILNCIFTRNTYYGFLNGTGWVVPGDNEFGLTFPVGGNGVISNCRSEENRGLNANLSNPGALFVFDFVSGLANYDVSNVTIDKCIIQDNSNDGYIIAADHDGSRNIKWTNSVITKTRSSFEPADGLHFSGSIAFTVGGCTGGDYPLLQGYNITVENCTSTDNKSFGSRSVGFLFAYVQGSHISGNNASGMSGNTSAAGFYVVGGLPGGRSSYITLVNNTAERNGSEGSGRAAGFLIENVSNDIVLKNNIANGNGTNSDFDFQYGAGILVRASNRDSLATIYNVDIDNCTCKGNGNGTDISAGITILNEVDDPPTDRIINVAIEKCVSKFNNGFGVLVSDFGPQAVAGVSVNETEIYQNTIGGLKNVSFNTIFASRNMSYLNGLGGNYDGIPVTTIVVGTTNNFPDNPGMKNVSIVNA
jgi:hypothetical protein